MKKRYWYVDCTNCRLGDAPPPEAGEQLVTRSWKAKCLSCGKEDMYATAVLLAEGVE